MRKDDLTHYRQEESSSHDKNNPTTQNATLFGNSTWEVDHISYKMSEFCDFLLRLTFFSYIY